MAEPKTKQQRYEAWLKKHFEFRYNIILNLIEYAEKKAPERGFVPMTDYALNSMVRFLDKEYNEAPSPEKVFSILKSDFTPKYHPIKAYFLKWYENHKHHKGTSYIDALAATVTVENPETFRLSLTRWLVASVAQVFVDEIKFNDPKANDCQNQTCIVLTGSQGAFKTTWLNMLCPTELAEYLYTGKINLNLDNKDIFIMLGEKFIINLDDQLRNLIKKDNETMKTLITQGKNSIRRPHAKFAENIQRLGNFVASINGEDFLSEDENRRYLPFAVQSIDIKEAQLIDMDGVWLDAFILFKSGFQYWWTKAELAEYFGEQMENFRYSSPELEMLHTHFSVPSPNDTDIELMCTTDVINYLSAFTKERLGPKKIGEELKKMGAAKKSDPDRGNLKCYALQIKKLKIKTSTLNEWKSKI
ncbi:VapE domain-containing protein [Runella sp.]|uniref:VapE domain-containing protein n=1 Tax=Runella sp. TaxID=1960881 RepID=UPI003D0B7A77